MKKILLAACLAIVSFNIYAESVIDHCQDIVIPWEGRKLRIDVFTEPNALIGNDTNIDQTIHVEAKTIDLQTGETGLWIEDKVIAPHKQWSGSPNVKLYMTIPSHGNHYFKGTVIITGYKNFYAESTCHVQAKKYDFGDFINGMQKH